MKVLVVGAGPVGLTVAVELRLRGVQCRVVDRLPQAAPYAKAVGIQPRTLEMWERQGHGLLRDVLDRAVPMRGQLVFVNGTQVSRLDLAVPPDVPFGFVALPQNVTEHLLAERLGRLGGRVERGVELVGFDQDADGVTVGSRIRTGSKRRGSPTSWARTALTVGSGQGLGLAFAGDAFSEEYMLGDVEVDWSLPQGYGIRSMHQAEGAD